MNSASRAIGKGAIGIYLELSGPERVNKETRIMIESIQAQLTVHNRSARPRKDVSICNRGNGMYDSQFSADSAFSAGV